MSLQARAAACWCLMCDVVPLCMEAGSPTLLGQFNFGKARLSFHMLR